MLLPSLLSHAFWRDDLNLELNPTHLAVPTSCRPGPYIEQLECLDVPWPEFPHLSRVLVLLFLFRTNSSNAKINSRAALRHPAAMNNFEGLESSRIDLLVPNALSAFLQAFETGIILSQSTQFWRRAEGRVDIVKCIVSWVTIVAV